ncbi:hypothetical protein CFP56_043980 [Quercus suber]|uniref:Uncharacterized protein n=1 Tax=Quercus suber TaxID=58331 RepID=A0AAW0IPU5_QUESU
MMPLLSLSCLVSATPEMTTMMKGKITKHWTLRAMSWDSLFPSLSILPIGRKDWYNQFMTSQN